MSNYYEEKNNGLLPSAAECKSTWCSLVSSNTAVRAQGSYARFQVTGVIQGFF